MSITLYNNMTKSIFSKYNEQVRKAHIEKYGVDIDDLTIEQKKRYFVNHRVQTKNF